MVSVTQFNPDVHVVEYPKTQAGGSSPTAGHGVAIAEPILVHVERDPMSQGYIEIVDAESGNQVVTVIEFLSPTNKISGDEQSLYTQKTEESYCPPVQSLVN